MNGNYLWKVHERPDQAGMFSALALLRGGKIVFVSSENRSALEQHLIEMQIQLADDGEDRFLHAWKRGVKLAGVELFYCNAESIDAATDKEQLRPQWEPVQSYIRQPISPGERLFVIELCSFYNCDWMHQLKKELRLKRGSFGQAAARLDAERLAVLADLLVSYRGW